ncbi:MAG: hypothetical protein JWP11_2384 [Frankiales bacterium]|nr:hypothetical protein [Frankiales bacterium]
MDTDLFPSRRQGLMTAAQLRRAGVPRATLSRAVAAGQVVRLRRNVYALSRLGPLPRFIVTEAGVAADYVRHVRAVLMSLGPRATASGRTAAALRGWGLLVEPSRTIQVAVPHGRGRSRARDVVITQRRRIGRERVVAAAFTEGLWLTDAVQTVIDCCVLLPLVEAVVVCDSALRAGDVTLPPLRRAARRQCGVREARRVRQVLRLADPESGSVLESVLRVKLVLAGVTGFSTQVVIAACRVDFCFRRCRLVVEADGAKWHQDPRPDRVRDNALACAGYRVLRYTWQEILHDSARVIAEIQAALRGTEGIQSVTQGHGLAA